MVVVVVVVVVVVALLLFERGSFELSTVRLFFLISQIENLSAKLFGYKLSFETIHSSILLRAFRL